MSRVVVRSDNPNSFVTGNAFSVDEPAETVMAKGMAGDSLGHRNLCEEDGASAAPNHRDGKPEYRVPLVSEIAGLPWNGFTVASLFAGCGGSSLGYRMAGFRVAWANEFVPIAQESYRANMAERTVLDGRDVRIVSSGDVLAACGVAEGDLDVLDGSPPCQAFSMAGKRHRGWGEERRYEHGAEQRNEDMFAEYVRLLRGIMPRSFVAENVSGLVKGVAKGYFLDILAALKGCGYRVEARVLDAQWLGVPQVRKRIIFVGVRDDLGLDPVFPKPLSYRYSIRDAIPWIDSCESGKTGFGAGSLMACEPAPTVSASGQAPYSGHAVTRVVDNRGGSHFKRRIIDTREPMNTILSGAGKRDETIMIARHDEKRKFTIDELRRLCGFPDDFELRGSYAQQWERLGNSVPPPMMFMISAALRDGVLLPARAAARTASPAERSRRRSRSG